MGCWKRGVQISLVWESKKIVAYGFIKINICGDVVFATFFGVTDYYQLQVTNEAFRSTSTVHQTVMNLSIIHYDLV